MQGPVGIQLCPSHPSIPDDFGGMFSSSPFCPGVSETPRGAITGDSLSCLPISHFETCTQPGQTQPQSVPVPGPFAIAGSAGGRDCTAGEGLR